VSNFDKSIRIQYEKAIELFMSRNPKIKVWIEDSAFDSIGRKNDEMLSLHSDGSLQDKHKWIKFYKSLNERKLMEGEIPTKINLKERLKTWVQSKQRFSFLNNF
jgi:predicted AAA+ superfamily ATPase